MNKLSWIERIWIDIEKCIDELKCNHKRYGYKIGEDITNGDGYRVTKVFCGRCGKKGLLLQTKENNETWGRLRFPVKEDWI